METYLKSDVLDHNYSNTFAPYVHKDAGRFDICRSCPLKMAVLSSGSKVK